MVVEYYLLVYKIRLFSPKSDIIKGNFDAVWNKGADKHSRGSKLILSKNVNK